MTITGELRADPIHIDTIEDALRAAGVWVDGPVGYVVDYREAMDNLRLELPILADSGMDHFGQYQLYKLPNCSRGIPTAYLGRGRDTAATNCQGHCSSYEPCPDSVNPLPITRSAWHQAARDVGVPFIEVETRNWQDERLPVWLLQALACQAQGDR